MYKSLSSFLSKLLAASLILALLMSAAPVSTAFAADTGLNSPTACTSAQWGNPGNAVSSNNQYATSNAGGQTLVCTFNLPAIPAGNLITGIEVRIEGSATGAREADIDLSWNAGTGYTTGDPNTNFGTAETTFTLGGTTDTWNRAWAVGDFLAANFRVRLTSTNVFGVSAISLDHVQVRVTYIPAAEIDVQGNGVSITDGDTTPSLADHTDFGNVPLNFSVDRTFTIRNADVTNNLTIGAVTFIGGDAGDFNLVSAPAASVAPGGSTTFTVRLTAGGFGGATRNTTVNIVVTNDADENPFNFNIQGTRFTANIDVQGNGISIADGDTTPSLADHTHFGYTTVGVPVTRTYTIVNGNATETLYVGTTTIGGANAGDFTVTVPPSATVAPNGTTTFTVQFNPSATGFRNGSISFINNDDNESPYNFNIQGAVAPEIDVQGNGISIVDGDTTPSLADHTHFGNTGASAPVTRTYTIENTGSLPLTLGAITIGGANAGDFAIINPLPVSPVAPSGTTTLTVQFTPLGAGTRNASISLVNNDTNESPYNFNIQGTSFPEIDVQGNGTSIADGDNSPSTTDGTDFGTVAVGSTVIHTFTIYNTGTSNLTLSTPTLLGAGATANYTISASPTSPVPPGGSTTFDISFSPTAVFGSTKNATVSITNNDPNESPYTFAITGTRPVPEIDIQGNSISIVDGDVTSNFADGTQWGFVGVGIPIDHTFTIYNTGAADLNLSNARITGSTISFSVLTPPAATVAPGGSTTVVIRFSPSATGGGTKDAVFLVDNDDPNENPYSFDLQGTRLDTGAEIDVQGAGLSIVDGDTTPTLTDDTNFGNVNVGSNATHTFTIYNYGPSDLTIGAFTFTGNFSLTSGPASTTVAGGSSTTFTVQFAPSALGVQTGSVSFVNNDTGTENPYNFSLTGTGIDTMPPAVTVEQATGQVDPANLTPINFTVTFSEPINLTSFTDTDLAIGGTAGATTAVITEIAPNDGTTFNVAISGMTGSGDVTLSLAGGKVNDIVGNGNDASTSSDNTVMYDATAPTLTVEQATGQVDPTNVSTINFTVTFNKPINLTSFTDTDLTIGGTAGATTAVITEIAPNDGTTFNVAISGMTGSGTVILSLAQNMVADLAGNGNDMSASSDNTVMYDALYPQVLFNANTVPTQNAALASTVLQITVAFSEDVKNDGSAGAANNVVNYLLVEDGANGVFDTLSCIGGLLTDDTQVAVNTVSYTNNGGSGPFIATLNINGGLALPAGSYRLFICGTTSIVDLTNNELNGGVNDTTITFTVTASTNNNNNDRSLNGFLIPVTGFPQGQVTSLSNQPSELTYTSYSDLWLEIPKLKLKTSVVGVPTTSDGWNVSWLGNDAGWLNGSAFPTWAGNSVITAHVWDALNRPGPFAELKNLKYGDQVKVHAFGQVFTYEIRETKTVSPTSTYTVFRHEEKSWITLVTCEDYKEGSHTYSHRRMVRAVLVKVASE